MYVRSWLEDKEMDKYFDVDEMMIEYSEMAGFDFGSKAFQEIRREVRSMQNRHILSNMVTTIALIL